MPSTLQVDECYESQDEESGTRKSRDLWRRMDQMKIEDYGRLDDEESSTTKIKHYRSGSFQRWKRSSVAAALFLFLFCVLLLAGIIALSVHYNEVRDQLKASYSNLTEERDQLKASYSSLTKERDKLKASYSNMTEERDQLKASYSNLTEERDQLKASYSNLTKREQLKASYSNLTEERDQLKASYSNLTDERDQLKASYSNLTKREQLKDSYSNLTEERDQLKASYRNLTEEKDQLKASYSNLMGERDQLKASNSNLTEERDQLKGEKDKLNELLNLCNSGWKQFGSSFYFVSAEKKTWNASRQDCLNRGAYLVIVNSEAEQRFLHGLSGSLYAHIGLHDTKAEGLWEWINDGPSRESSALKTYWNDGEPNNSGEEDCVVDVELKQYKTDCGPGRCW
ncbi:hypothetical protein DPEC_G00181900 [Dallia pectoralis]|uniref:Uncharacterized protein n=1 Tax=Dallia pectoralis TaxID=75939 RepID=A0ACC2GA85_DALPE|nr:hypothetical protein DPEC_G00181900 [Dallia pectoralis]